MDIHAKLSAAQADLFRRLQQETGISSQADLVRLALTELARLRGLRRPDPFWIRMAGERA